jgi:hypothetical protein
VVIAFDENLTNGMTFDGAKIDLQRVLKALRDSQHTFKSVRIIGTLGLVDKFGKMSEDTVVEAIYNWDTAQQINWDNFQFDNVFDIADSKWVHPALKKK